MRFSQTKQFKAICFSLIFSFLSTSLTQSAPLELPNPQQFILLSSAYSFPVLKGLKFDPANPLKMEFIVDTGDKKDISPEEAGLLIKYFLAGLTTPEKDIWVNLSPYEQERIIPEALSQTDLGKDLLSQDYLLKQLISSLTYPESDTGKDYWDKTYAEVMKIAKTTKLPVNTFNKVWIMPDEAEIYESDNAGLITKAKLKVMLEEDYLAFKNREQKNTCLPAGRENRGQQTEKGKEDERDARINKAASKVMKEVILPKINSEVNSGKNFATLRQIYYSLILGLWFKQKFQDSIYQHYINQNKLKGLDLEDKTVKEKIYQQYVAAFKTGLYNYIKTDQEPSTHKKIKRRYYSGGFAIPQDFNPRVNRGRTLPETVSSALEKNVKSIEVALRDPRNGFPNDETAPAVLANSPLQLEVKTDPNLVEDKSILNWSINGKSLEEILNLIIKEYDVRFFDGKGSREKYPQQVDEKLLLWLGRALGTAEFFSKVHGQTVSLKPGDTFLIGGDNGPSTEWVRKNLIQGLIETGVNVIDLGMVSSGELFSSISRFNTHGGLYVTRSHVEIGTNGFKPAIGGITLYGDMLHALKEQILSVKYRKTAILGKLDASQESRQKSRKMYLASLKNEFSTLMETLNKSPIPVAVNLGGGSAVGYKEVFEKLLGTHLVKVFRDESDPLNENGGLADPSRSDDVGLSHPKANIMEYSRKNPKVLIFNFDLDSDRVGIVWAGKKYSGDELFYPVVEYMLTHDKYKDLNQTFYYDARMNPVIGQLIKYFEGIAIIHPKGHSKVKASMNILLRQIVQRQGFSNVEEFLVSHPGFFITQPEYSLHMFQTDEKGTPIDDALRFSLFWLKAFSDLKKKYSTEASRVGGAYSRKSLPENFTLSQYIDYLKEKKIISESFSLEEQRTDMPEQAKIEVMQAMKKNTINFFQNKADFESVDWSKFTDKKKPFTLVELEGVFYLMTPSGIIYWGWSNTALKVAFGAHSSNPEDLKKLSEILLALFVHTRNQIARQIGMALPRIIDKETVALAELFGYKPVKDKDSKIIGYISPLTNKQLPSAAEDIETQVLEKYSTVDTALEALVSLTSSAVSLELIPPRNTVLANRVSGGNVSKFTKSKIFNFEEGLVKAGMELDPEAFGQALLFGKRATRHGEPMQEALKMLDRFYQRHFGERPQDFKGDVEIAGIGIGGQMDVTNAIVGTLRYSKERNSFLLASLGKDYNAIEERWIKFLHQENDPKLFWVVGSKSGTTPETMINFQETAKTMLRVWARKLYGDEKGKAMADKLINKLYDGKPLYEKQLSTLNLSDEEKEVFKKVFSALIVATGDEKSGSLLAKLINKSFINELYAQEDEKVVIIDLPANLGGRKQSIGPNAAAYALGLGVDILKMLSASREIAQEIEDAQQQERMHLSKKLAIKLLLSQAKQFIIVHPNDIIFSNVTGALEQIIPESLGKGRPTGFPVGMQTYSFNKDDMNNSAFVRDVKGVGRAYLVIDVEGQKPIELAKEILENNWVIRYTLKQVSEGELSKLFQFVEEVTMRYGFFNVAQALLKTLEDKALNKENLSYGKIELSKVISGPSVNDLQYALYKKLHETYKDFSPDRQPNVEKAKKITKEAAARLFNINPGELVFDENGLSIRTEWKRKDYYSGKENIAVNDGVGLLRKSLGLTNEQGKYVTGKEAEEELSKKKDTLEIGLRRGLLDTDRIRNLLEELEKLQKEISLSGVPRDSFENVDKLVERERGLFAKIKKIASDGNLTETLDKIAQQLAVLAIKAHNEGKSLDFVLYEDRTPLLEALARFAKYLGTDKFNFGTIEQHKSFELSAGGVDVSFMVLIESVKTLANLKEKQRPIIYDGLVGKEVDGLYPSEVNALNLEAYIEEFQKVKTGVAALMTKDVTEQENLIDIILLFTRMMEIVQQTTASSALTKASAPEEIDSAIKKRNAQDKSNFPADIKKENPQLFEALKQNKMSFYSKLDNAIYVWDADGLEQALLKEYAAGNNDEKMRAIFTIDENGNPIARSAGRKQTVLNLILREDRQRQLAQVIVDENFKEFPDTQESIPAERSNIDYYAMKQYTPKLLKSKVMIEGKPVKNGLVEVLNAQTNPVPAIHIRSIEKSEFLPIVRGGRTEPFANEDLDFASISEPVLMTEVQVQSGQFRPYMVVELKEKEYASWFVGEVPKGLQQIPNDQYWLYPGLNAFVLAKASKEKAEAAKGGAVGFVSLDLPDLIGHVAIKNLNKTSELFIQKKDGTFEIKYGNGWDSVLASLEISDQALKTIIDPIKEKQGVVLLFGDHGSVDDMTQPGHSYNDVPIFIVDFKNKDVKLVKAKGKVKDTQADIAVTTLHILGIQKPVEMTGKSLLPDDYIGSPDRLVWQILFDGFGHTNFEDPQNAFGVAMKQGIMPTVKSLYDQNNYVILAATGDWVGLRGRRQEEFPKESIMARADMLKRVKELSDQNDQKLKTIQITFYDYKDLPSANRKYSYNDGIRELERSPFLNDKDFVVKDLNGQGMLEILALDPAQMGSTEYNTATIYAGTIVEQSIRTVDRKWLQQSEDPQDDSFFKLDSSPAGDRIYNSALQNYTQASLEQGYAYIMTMLQEAAVHSSNWQLHYSIGHLKNKGIRKFVFDLYSDGRDEGSQNAINRLRELRQTLNYFGISDYAIHIRGRQMLDRAKNYEKTTRPLLNQLLYGTNKERKEVSRPIRYSFNTQLERLDKFMSANRGKGSIKGRIEEVFASVYVFLSKTATIPTFGAGITTHGASATHDQAQGGTSAGTKEPFTFSKKNAYQDKELEIFNKHIKPALLGKNVANALELDEILEEIGRSLKPGADSPDLIYGGPAITATSMNIIRSLARSANVDEEVVLFRLYNQLAKEYDAPKLEEMTLPIFMAKSNDGGMHGATRESDLLSAGKVPVLPIQEFLFIPAGYNTYEEALRALREVTAKFYKLVKEIDPDFKYGAEAAIKSEKLSSNRQVLELMTQAIQETQAAGMFIGIDTAASELYKPDKGYYFGDDAKQLYKSEDGFINTGQVIDYYEKLVEDFPRLISIEDGFSEHDVAGWKKGTERLGYRLNLVADDVTVTAPEIVEKGAEEKWANALLNKINQAGTMRRSLLASIIVRALPVKKHRLFPWLIAVSHRSGEPANQDMIAILAIAIAAEFIKTTVGSIEGGGQGREAKVNSLSMISEKWRNRGAPLPYAGARMLKNPLRGFEKTVKEFTENKIFGNYEENAASSAINNPNRIAELKMGGTLEELYESPSDDVGGINLEDIAEKTRVKSGSTSSPLPKIDGDSPAYPLIPADFPNWPGLFFKIVRIEDIEDLERMFTEPLYAKADSP